MKIQLIIVLSLLASVAFGQEKTVEQNLLEIIRVSLADNKLPAELINNRDSLGYPPTVGIESTSENKLESYESLKWGKVEIWIWEFSNMLEQSIYWLAPSNVKINDSEGSFDFNTYSLGSDEKLKNYRGTIKAKKRKGLWIVTSSKLVESPSNHMDIFKKMKESNVRGKKLN